jgi:hypothetical protein
MTEAARGSVLAEANLDLNPLLAPEGPNSEPQTTSTPPLAEQPLLEAIPEASQVPKAKRTNRNGEGERSRKSKTAEAGSSGIVGPGVAGPSNAASSTTFAYSESRAQEIWRRACTEDYLGAHALFDPQEQVIFIDGEANVRRYLRAHPQLKTHLVAPKDGKSRECLYLCGASAIWKRVQGPTKQTAGATPQYKLTYEPCHASAYATVDNYKKHIYRHHLGKQYKQYPKKADAKGKEKAVTENENDHD